MLESLQIRNKTFSLIRSYFESENFFETDTPCLVPVPGSETHLKAFKTIYKDHFSGIEQALYLQTSPEFSMKKILGEINCTSKTANEIDKNLLSGKIFQISHSFRNSEFSTTHNPEFTMLEWYRLNSDYKEIMSDTEKLFESFALKLHGSTSILYKGENINLKTPWPRLTMREAFIEFADIDFEKAHSTQELYNLAIEKKSIGMHGADPENETWDDIFFRILMNDVEPKFYKNRPLIIYDYPASQSALAKLKEPERKYAERFEFYIGGQELGNAFSELTDKIEQEQRFKSENQYRINKYNESWPIDNKLLNALEKIDTAAGMAIGLERMMMLFWNKTSLDEVMPLRFPRD